MAVVIVARAVHVSSEQRFLLARAGLQRRQLADKHRHRPDTAAPTTRNKRHPAAAFHATFHPWSEGRRTRTFPPHARHSR